VGTESTVKTTVPVGVPPTALTVDVNVTTVPYTAVPPVISEVSVLDVVFCPTAKVRVALVGA
jgi:hypothetical protein